MSDGVCWHAVAGSFAVLDIANTWITTKVNVQPVEATDSNQFTRRTTHLRPRPSAGCSLQRRLDTCPPNTADRHTSLVIKQYAISSCKAVNARRTHKLSLICHSIAGG